MDKHLKSLWPLSPAAYHDVRCRVFIVAIVVDMIASSLAACRDNSSGCMSLCHDTSYTISVHNQLSVPYECQFIFSGFEFPVTIGFVQLQCAVFTSFPLPSQQRSYPTRTHAAFAISWSKRMRPIAQVWGIFLRRAGVRGVPWKKKRCTTER